MRAPRTPRLRFETWGNGWRRRYKMWKRNQIKWIIKWNNIKHKSHQMIFSTINFDCAFNQPIDYKFTSIWLRCVNFGWFFLVLVTFVLFYSHLVLYNAWNYCYWYSFNENGALLYTHALKLCNLYLLWSIRDINLNKSDWCDRYERWASPIALIYIHWVDQ